MEKSLQSLYKDIIMSEKRLDKYVLLVYDVFESEVFMSNYIIVGGGWSGTSSTGETFVRLKFKNSIPEGMLCTMWKNKKKESDKHPDYLIMAAIRGEEKPKSSEDLF